MVNCETFKSVMISKGKAYLKIQELVVRFDEQIDSYKQTDYNEILTRRDFIDPFFKALDGTWIIHKDMQSLSGSHSRRQS